MRISDWSSDVCSSDLRVLGVVMADRTESEIHRGEQAARLLNEPLMIEAFATIEQELTEQWQNSPARDAEGREKLWLSLKLLHRVRGHLTNVLETGQIEERKSVW